MISSILLNNIWQKSIAPRNRSCLSPLSFIDHCYLLLGSLSCSELGYTIFGKITIWYQNYICNDNMVLWPQIFYWLLVSTPLKLHQQFMLFYCLNGIHAYVGEAINSSIIFKMFHLMTGTVCCLAALYHSSAFWRRQFREQFKIGWSY